MTPKSLRLRQALIAGASIALAMIVAGFGLVTLFERHVTRRVDAELDTYIRALAANLSFGADGALQLSRPLADPRFSQPLSGLYWQVEEEGAAPKTPPAAGADQPPAGPARLRSRSLWDDVIALPADQMAPGVVHRHLLAGPGGATLMVSELRVAYTADEGTRKMRIAAAVDRQDVVTARREFAGDVSISLGILAIILLTTAWVQIVLGLKPLETLRRSVMAVRSGEQPRIAAGGPEEIMPLVSEVNSLLDAQAAAMESAKARAADLAHGLKTPLTVMTMDAQRLRQNGETEIASELEELAASMRRHISRELFRARLQSAARAIPPETPIRDVLERIVRIASRSANGAELTWNIGIPPGLTAAMRVDDLAEMAGALIENAAKWAGSEVCITAAATPASRPRETPAASGVRIVIEDDGPGVSPEKLERLGQRGVRLDETVEGSGLGLAIARDAADAYGGRITFGNREPHGFRVEIYLPHSPQEGAG
jgi:signal transduction histidine kinase